MQNPLKSVSNRLWVLEELSTYTDARAPRAHVHDEGAQVPVRRLM